MEAIKVESVVLKIGKKQITLTVQEAKQLQTVLDETLGSACKKTHYYPWWQQLYTNSNVETGKIYNSSLPYSTIATSTDSAKITSIASVSNQESHSNDSA